MSDDPIVAAVRAVREELSRPLHYDLHAIFADMRSRETDHGSRLVRQSHDARPNQAMQPSGGSDDLPVKSSFPAAG